MKRSVILSSTFSGLLMTSLIAQANPPSKTPIVPQNVGLQSTEAFNPEKLLCSLTFAETRTVNIGPNTVATLPLKEYEQHQKQAAKMVKSVIDGIVKALSGKSDIGWIN